MRIATLIKRAGVKKLLVAAGALFVVAGGILTVATQSNAESCPTNDIMPCGAKDADGFIAKLKKNSPSDMDNIYADGRYDLPKSEYDNFARYAKKGKINPDTGNVTVDGVTVMKDAKSIGRNSKGSISKAITIDGKKYYETPIRLLTKYTNDAMVLFDAKGNVQTVIMNLCGNPMTNTEVNPKYNCDALKATSVDRDTYKFSSVISASNGATVTKVVYDFGDGTTHTEKSPSTVVEHTYAKAGSYTAKVTAYVKTKFGRGEFAITVTADCKKTITIKEEDKPSIDINKTVENVEHKVVGVNTEYTYQIAVTNTGNVTLKDAKVTDTPETDVTLIKGMAAGSTTAIGTISNNTWVYTIPELKVGETKNFNLTAKVPTYKAGTIKNTVCVDTPTVPGAPDDCDDATVEVPEPVYRCDALTVTPISRTVFDFKETHTVQNASYVRTVFIVRNSAGTEIARTTSADSTLRYTQTTVGNYSVEAQVIVNVNGQEKVASSENCKNSFTVKEEEKPAIDINKTVENVEHKVVGVNVVYTYQIVVTNKGNVVLKDAKVSDAPQAGITLIKGSLQGSDSAIGTIANNTWTYTIPELKVGEQVKFNLTAKVPTYVAGTLKNTVCVDSPTVPGTPDDCDDATVEVPEPVYRCDALTVTQISRTVFDFKETHTVQNATYLRTIFIIRNSVGAEIARNTSTNSSLRYTQTTVGRYTVEAQVVFSVNGTEKTVSSSDCKKAFEVCEEPKVEVCDPKTGTIISVPVSEKDKYEDKDSPKCKPVQVCDAKTGTIIYVPYKDKDQYEPVDSIKCKSVRVCDPTDGIEKDVPYKDKDNYLPVGSKECGMTRVCDPKTGNIIDVPYKDKDQYESESSEKCQDVLVCNPETGTEINVPYKDKDSYLPIGSKECGMVKVCEPATGKIIEVAYKDKDQFKDVADAACKEKPPVTPEEPEEPETPTELPKTGFADGFQAVLGIGSLTAASYYYIASRRN